MRQSDASEHREHERDPDFGSIFASVARLLTAKEVAVSKDAQDAIVKEADKLQSFGTWNLDSVVERSVAARKARTSGVETHFGFVFAIVSEKHAELKRGPGEQELKARLVFSGNRITTEFGQHALFSELASAPATMTATRATICFGSQPGYTVEVVDATSAYLQAYLDGRDVEGFEGVTTLAYVELPKWLWPASWHGRYERPCVVLEKALYGHPQSGLRWEQRCTALLQKCGWKPVSTWPSVFRHDATGSVLCVYVDDILLAAKTSVAPALWKQIRSCIVTGEPAPLDRYLGCRYLKSVENFKGKEVTVVASDMSEFFDSCVERWREVAEAAADKHNLSSADRRKLLDLKKAPTPFLDNSKELANRELPRGLFFEGASSVLMKMLYGCRSCRPDMSKAVCSLAQGVTVWSTAHDASLKRLIEYCLETKDYVQTSFVGNDLSQCQIHLWADADFASDLSTRRSTTGTWVECVGSHTQFALSWTSQRQTAISTSTPEAEIVAGAHGIRRDLVPISELMDQFVGGHLELAMHEDNTRAEDSLVSGKTKAMMHLNRTHDVNLKMISETVARERIKMFRSESSSMRADILTKPMHEFPKWRHALGLIRIGLRDILSSFSSFTTFS